MSNAVPHDVSFNFVPRAYRPAKPRTFGTTEIRAPYCSSFGTRHLSDVFDVAGQWVDGIKWAGGSFALGAPEQVRAFSDIAHEHDAYVSSGGWLETVLRYGDDAVDHYLKEAKEVGFDVIEISTGFIMLNTSGLLPPRREGRQGRAQGEAGARAADRLRRRLERGRAGRREQEGHRRPRRPRQEGARRRRVDHHDRVGGDHRERLRVGHRRGRVDHQRAGPQERHVRGRRRPRVRVVRQELRQRG